MRLIDADKLKHKIMYANHDIDEDWYGLYDSVIEEIDNAPTIEPKTNTWIPVSERLPDDEVEVLIYTTDKETNKAYRRIKEWTIDRMEWVVFETLGYSYIYGDDEVLAWMPKPESYKAENVIKES